MAQKLDPSDTRVETLTPKQFESEHGIDLRSYGHVTFRDSEGVAYRVALDFVETNYGTRAYWKCPRCQKRCHKLLTIGASRRYACRGCFEDLGVLAYHCQALKGNPAWETFGHHLHKAAKARRRLEEQQPRGDKKERLLLTMLIEQDTALVKQHEYYSMLVARFRDKQEALDLEYEKWMQAKGFLG